MTDRPTTNTRLILALLTMVSVFVVGVLLHELRSVLLPFVLAILLSNIFEPVVAALKRRRVPTFLSLLVVVASFALVLLLFTLILYSSFGSFAREFPKYEARLEIVVDGFWQKMVAFAASLDLSPESINWRDAIHMSSLTAAVTSGIGSFLTFVTYTFLVLMFMLFILAETGQLTVRITSAFSKSQTDRITAILYNIDKQVRQYLLTKTIVSAITGTVTSVVLAILGVDFALLWGFLTFLLNFIPNLGSAIAVLLPFSLSLLQFETMTTPILVILLLGLTQVLMGNIVEPNLMAFSLNLSAIVILISLIFWGWLWGIVGMLLAVPLTATIKIIFENIDALRPISVLMTGKLDTHA